MLSSLTNYFDSDAISRLEDLYGGRLQKLPKLDILALILALAECAYALDANGVSDRLDLVCAEHGHQYQDDEAIMDILYALDAEITDVREVLSLISGLATFVRRRPPLSEF